MSYCLYREECSSSYYEKEKLIKDSLKDVEKSLMLFFNDLDLKKHNNEDVVKEVFDCKGGSEALANDLLCCEESHNLRNLSSLKAYLFLEKSLKYLSEKGNSRSKIFYLFHFLDNVNFKYGKDNRLDTILDYYQKMFDLVNRYYKEDSGKSVFKWLEEKDVEERMYLTLPILYFTRKMEKKIICFLQIKVEFRGYIEFFKDEKIAFPLFDFYYELVSNTQIYNSGNCEFPIFDDIFIDGILRSEKYLEPKNDEDYFRWYLENSGAAEIMSFSFPYIKEYEDFVKKYLKENECLVIKLGDVDFIEKKEETKSNRVYLESSENDQMEELREYERAMINDDEDWNECFKDEDLTIL